MGPWKVGNAFNNHSGTCKSREMVAGNTGLTLTLRHLWRLHPLRRRDTQRRASGNDLFSSSNIRRFGNELFIHYHVVSDH